jgi:hypothetical protein
MAMGDSTLKPNLRVIKLMDLLPHEGTDPLRVDRLISELLRTRTLHEPVLGTTHNSQTVILDGATRYAAFQALGIRDLLVQYVDYDVVEVEAWVHVIEQPPLSDLMPMLENLPGLRLRTAATRSLFAGLNRSTGLLGLITRDGRGFWLQTMKTGRARLSLLNQVVDLYRGQGIVHRTTQTDLDALRNTYPGMVGMVLFPRFSQEDIIQAAVSGHTLPMGVSRHIVQCRISNLDIPLSFLADGAPVALKQGRLWKLTRSRSNGSQAGPPGQPGPDMVLNSNP